MKKVLLAIGLLAASVGAAQAQDRQYRVSGPGAVSCYEYLDVPEDSDTDRMFISWAQGFITYHLMNRDMPLSRNEISNDFLKRNVNNYCKENPTEDFFKAVVQHGIILNGIAGDNN